jgi:hypothetical protein
VGLLEAANIDKAAIDELVISKYTFLTQYYYVTFDKDAPIPVTSEYINANWGQNGGNPRYNIMILVEVGINYEDLEEALIDLEAFLRGDDDDKSELEALVKAVVDAGKINITHFNDTDAFLTEYLTDGVREILADVIADGLADAKMTLPDVVKELNDEFLKVSTEFVNRLLDEAKDFFNEYFAPVSDVVNVNNAVKLGIAGYPVGVAEKITEAWEAPGESDTFKVAFGKAFPTFIVFDAEYDTPDLTITFSYDKDEANDKVYTAPDVDDEFEINWYIDYKELKELLIDFYKAINDTVLDKKAVYDALKALSEGIELDWLDERFMSSEQGDAYGEKYTREASVATFKSIPQVPGPTSDKSPLWYEYVVLLRAELAIMNDYVTNGLILKTIEDFLEVFGDGLATSGGPAWATISGRYGDVYNTTIPGLETLLGGNVLTTHYGPLNDTNNVNAGKVVDHLYWLMGLEHIVGLDTEGVSRVIDENVELVLRRTDWEHVIIIAFYNKNDIPTFAINDPWESVVTSPGVLPNNMLAIRPDFGSAEVPKTLEEEIEVIEEKIAKVVKDVFGILDNWKLNVVIPSTTDIRMFLSDAIHEIKGEHYMFALADADKIIATYLTGGKTLADYTLADLLYWVEFDTVVQHNSELVAFLNALTPPIGNAMNLALISEGVKLQGFLDELKDIEITVNKVTSSILSNYDGTNAVDYRLYLLKFLRTLTTVGNYRANLENSTNSLFVVNWVDKVNIALGEINLALIKSELAVFGELVDAIDDDEEGDFAEALLKIQTDIGDIGHDDNFDTYYWEYKRLDIRAAALPASVPGATYEDVMTAVKGIKELLEGINEIPVAFKDIFAEILHIATDVATHSPTDFADMLDAEVLKLYELLDFLGELELLDGYLGKAAARHLYLGIASDIEAAVDSFGGIVTITDALTMVTALNNEFDGVFFSDIDRAAIIFNLTGLLDATHGFPTFIPGILDTLDGLTGILEYVAANDNYYIGLAVGKNGLQEIIEAFKHGRPIPQTISNEDLIVLIDAIFNWLEGINAATLALRYNLTNGLPAFEDDITLRGEYVYDDHSQTIAEGVTVTIAKGGKLTIDGVVLNLEGTLIVKDGGVIELLGGGLIDATDGSLENLGSLSVETGGKIEGGALIEYPVADVDEITDADRGDKFGVVPNVTGSVYLVVTNDELTFSFEDGVRDGLVIEVTEKTNAGWDDADADVEIAAVVTDRAELDAALGMQVVAVIKVADAIDDGGTLTITASQAPEVRDLVIRGNGVIKFGVVINAGAYVTIDNAEGLSIVNEAVGGVGILVRDAKTVKLRGNLSITADVPLVLEFVNLDSAEYSGRYMHDLVLVEGDKKQHVTIRGASIVTAFGNNLDPGDILRTDGLNDPVHVHVRVLLDGLEANGRKVFIENTDNARFVMAVFNGADWVVVAEFDSTT